jgi:hypothetical protein
MPLDVRLIVLFIGLLAQSIIASGEPRYFGSPDCVANIVGKFCYKGTAY